jgi:hypothetical protein
MLLDLSEAYVQAERKVCASPNENDAIEEVTPRVKCEHGDDLNVCTQAAKGRWPSGPTKDSKDTHCGCPPHA